MNKTFPIAAAAVIAVTITGLAVFSMPILQYAQAESSRSSCGQS